MQDMDPVWEKYSEDSDGVVVSEVNCDEEKPLCEAYAVGMTTVAFCHFVC